MRRVQLSLLIWSTISLQGVTGCDSGSTARVAEAERTIQAQKGEIEALDRRLSELETKVTVFDFAKDRYKSAALDPSDQGFDRLDTSVGSFAVSIQQVSAHADGVRVRLHVGNLTTATVNGGKFKVKWGTRARKAEGKDWISKYNSWEKSLLKKEISFTEELRPGTWNNVTLVLPGLPPEKFGHLELEMDSSQIKLLVPRR